MKALLFVTTAIFWPLSVFAQNAGPISRSPSISNLATVQLLNGWTPVFGVADSSNGTPATGGTGNSLGDVLTLNDGCSTHATVAVAGVSAGAVTSYNITGKGACFILPANPVSVLSTTGSGSGVTFTLTWAPFANSILPGSLTQNTGSTFLGGAIPASNFQGTESVFIGDYSGGNTTVGNFSVALGHRALGSGSGTCSGIAVNNVGSTVVGTDALRNGCGISYTTAIGVSALKSYVGNNTSNHSGFGTTAVGESAMYSWNGQIDFTWNTAIGAGACSGVIGSSAWYNGTCLGQNTGNALTTAHNFIEIGAGANGVIGATNFASGSNVILVGSGKAAVDTPAANTTNFVNIENAYIASTALPSYVSGFGTNAGAPGSAGSNGSKHFFFNVGTGGTASSGVFAFASAAPNGWYCTGRDKTNPASYIEDFTATSSTQVTVQNYSRTTGLTTPWTSGDQLEISCEGF